MENLTGKRIGFAITGSFCTFSKILEPIKELRSLGADITPIFSFHTASLDTRFYKAADFRADIETITEKKVIDTLQGAEPIGPKKLFDLIIVAPCTGNTLAKLANGITDTSVTMATKAQLRSDRPVLIALATNDGMSANLGNIGRMLSRKQVYFVPMVQDDIVKKPHSLVADFSRLRDTCEFAKNKKQIQKIFI